MSDSTRPSSFQMALTPGKFRMVAKLAINEYKSNMIKRQITMEEYRKQLRNLLTCTEGEKKADDIFDEEEKVLLPKKAKKEAVMNIIDATE